MTIFVKGTAPTINTDIAEKLLFGLIDGYGQSAERDVSKNPNQLNYVESSINGDALTASVKVSVPCVTDGEGITIPDYLVNTTYTNGVGSTFEGDNWLTTIFKIAVKMASDERDGAKNPQNYQNVSWDLTYRTDLGINNAVFTCTFVDFPLEITSNGMGGSTYEGKAYLVGAW